MLHVQTEAHMSLSHKYPRQLRPLVLWKKLRFHIPVSELVLNAINPYFEMKFLTTQRSRTYILENVFVKWALWDAVTTPYKQTYAKKPKPFALFHCETVGVNFVNVSGL
jgi:hypothetical protein